MNSFLKTLQINGVKRISPSCFREISKNSPKMAEISETSIPFNIEGAPIESSIRRKITENLKPVHLEILNESYKHNSPDSETHFKVLVISMAFANISLIQRHRMIHELLDEELKNGVHALSIVAKTPDQWSGAQLSPSPNCLGGFGK